MKVKLNGVCSADFIFDKDELISLNSTISTLIRFQDLLEETNCNLITKKVVKDDSREFAISKETLEILRDALICFRDSDQITKSNIEDSEWVDYNKKGDLSEC